MLLARLTRRSTIVALLLTVVLVVGVVRAAGSFDLNEVATTLNRANVAWLLVALAASWATFPLRGLRWRVILSASGLTISRRAATEILTLSFWVNCVLPAKMGDVYRGWVLKHNGATSFGNAVGTVVAERLVDLATVALLGAASTFVAFGGKLPPTALALTAIALGVAAATTLLLLVARGFAAALVYALPIPDAIKSGFTNAVASLRAGSGGRVIRTALPFSVAIWIGESLRLAAVATALGLFMVNPAAGQIGIASTIFVALVSAVLTVVPFTPAGIGIVEAGMVGILVALFGFTPESAIALALLDRLVGVGSLVVLGGGLFALSPFRRGVGSLR
ncbi:MAG: UPF0104 family protein [bacterium]|nr:UPF0104 family protein [Candidatus Aquidulcis sp.]